MFESVHAIDIFFAIMALSVAVATVIGGLVGWHVFGIVRDAHKIVRTVQEESKAVVHEVAVATKEVVEQKAAALRERVLSDMRIKVKKSPKKSGRKPATG